MTFLIAVTLHVFTVKIQSLPFSYSCRETTFSLFIEKPKAYKPKFKLSRAKLKQRRVPYLREPTTLAALVLFFSEGLMPNFYQKWVLTYEQLIGFPLWYLLPSTYIILLARVRLDFSWLFIAMSVLQTQYT